MSCRYQKCLDAGMDTKLIMGDRSKNSLAKYYPKEVPKESSKAGPSKSSESSQNLTGTEKLDQNSQLPPLPLLELSDLKKCILNTERKDEETSKPNVSNKVLDVVHSTTTQVYV